jgi:carbonic anhydrase
VTSLDEVTEANRQFAEEFEEGDLPPRPAKRLAVLTCMDARMHPEKFLGLEMGDAHVIRNAGGRASDDALRSLIVSIHKLDTCEIAVIHHTGCGMQTFTNEHMQRTLTRATGVDASGIDFLPFSDLEGSVRDDVRTIQESPYIPPHVRVRGFIYDVRTGRLSPVDGADNAGSGGI